MWRIVLHLTPLTTVLVLAALFLGSVGAHRASELRPRLMRRAAWTALTAWGLLVCAATLAGDGSEAGSGLVWWGQGVETLLNDSQDQVSENERSMIIRQWTANCLMFVPLPLLLSLSARRSVSVVRTMVVGLGASVMIEALQWLQGASRVADLEDVFFNTLGCAVGIGVNVLAVRTARRGSGRASVRSGP
ncbi:VanZ family protein [Streptomyces pini]|uniref:VanZ like family protein n=1 Tax=Streptomyces pini TaxID=1520580 RepID=A0A1I4KNK0_9ACTN|nr:VanZ family protein [Streptomyces pini]SFL80352.1 VanZ like family protein [Streptomyces pini]